MKIFAGIDIEKIKTAKINDLDDVIQKFTRAYFSRLQVLDTVHKDHKCSALELRKLSESEEISPALTKYLCLKVNFELFDYQTNSDSKQIKLIQYLLARMRECTPCDWRGHLRINTSLFDLSVALQNKHNVKFLKDKLLTLYECYMQKNLMDANTELMLIKNMKYNYSYSANLPHAIALKIIQLSVMLKLMFDHVDGDIELFSLYEKTCKILNVAIQELIDLPDNYDKIECENSNILLYYGTTGRSKSVDCASGRLVPKFNRATSF